MKRWTYRLLVISHVGVSVFVIGCITSMPTAQVAFGKVVWRSQTRFAYLDSLPEATNTPLWRHRFPLAANEVQAEFLEKSCAEVTRGDCEFSVALGGWLLSLRDDNIAKAYEMLWDRVLWLQADDYRKQVGKLLYDIDCLRMTPLEFCIYLKNEAELSAIPLGQDVPQVTIEYRGQVRDASAGRGRITLQRKGVSLPVAMAEASEQWLGTGRRNYMFYSDRIVVTDGSDERLSSEFNPVQSKVVYVATVHPEQMEALIGGIPETRSADIEMDYRRLLVDAFIGFEPEVTDVVAYDAGMSRLLVVADEKSVEALSRTLSKVISP